jgi:hypothetical protein
LLVYLDRGEESGGLGVVGSNPATPTIFPNEIRSLVAAED